MDTQIKRTMPWCRRCLAAAISTALALAAVQAAPDSGGFPAEDDLPPLYLTIIIHNEEDMSRSATPKAQIPDYDGDEALMRHFARAMRAFAEMAHAHGAVINFGSDWTFSRGVALYEPGFYDDIEAMGHEVDAHAHESSILYHEVREEISLAGGRPTHVASGMNEQDIQDQLDYFDEYYPEFLILWGVALPGHVAGECTATWVWRPSRNDWTRHDPNGRYIYIGNGELVNSREAIRSAIADRLPDRVNTYAVFVSPREFKAAVGTPGIGDEQWTAPTDSVHFWENRIQMWDDLLTEIDLFVQAGHVQYASLTEIAEIFVAQEDLLSFDFEEIPRSDASMRTRNARSGYPLD
jgi:hypothetical protein